MKLNFIGATHEVTGSCTYIEACGKRFLVDFGMEQGVDYFENAKIPCPPGNIDFVLLTQCSYRSFRSASTVGGRRLCWTDTRNGGHL